MNFENNNIYQVIYLLKSLRRIAPVSKTVEYSDEFIKQYFDNVEKVICFDYEKFYNNQETFYSEFVPELTSLLFFLLQQKKTEKDTFDLLLRLLKYDRNIGDLTDKKINVVLQIFLGMFIHEIKKGDFSLLRLFKNNLNENYYFAFYKSCRKEYFALFGILSIYLFYLAECSKTYPEKLKQRLRAFINDENVSPYYVYHSWSKLVRAFSKESLLSCFDLINLAKLYHHYEYSQSFETYTVDFNNKFILECYIILLGTTRNNNFENLLNTDQFGIDAKYELLDSLKDLKDFTLDSQKSIFYKISTFYSLNVGEMRNLENKKQFLTTLQNNITFELREKTAVSSDKYEELSSKYFEEMTKQISKLDFYVEDLETVSNKKLSLRLPKDFLNLLITEYNDFCFQEVCGSIYIPPKKISSQEASAIFSHSNSFMTVCDEGLEDYVKVFIENNSDKNILLEQINNSHSVESPFIPVYSFFVNGVPKINIKLKKLIFRDLNDSEIDQIIERNPNSNVYRYEGFSGDYEKVKKYILDDVCVFECDFDYIIEISGMFYQIEDEDKIFEILKET